MPQQWSLAIRVFFLVVIELGRRGVAALPLGLPEGSQIEPSWMNWWTAQALRIGSKAGIPEIELLARPLLQTVQETLSQIARPEVDAPSPTQSAATRVRLAERLARLRKIKSEGLSDPSPPELVADPDTSDAQVSMSWAEGEAILPTNVEETPTPLSEADASDAVSDMSFDTLDGEEVEAPASVNVLSTHVGSDDINGHEQPTSTVDGSQPHGAPSLLAGSQAMVESQTSHFTRRYEAVAGSSLVLVALLIAVRRALIASAKHTASSEALLPQHVQDSILEAKGETEDMEKDAIALEEKDISDFQEKDHPLLADIPLEAALQVPMIPTPYGSPMAKSRDIVDVPSPLGSRTNDVADESNIPEPLSTFVDPTPISILPRPKSPLADIQPTPALPAPSFIPPASTSIPVTHSSPTRDNLALMADPNNANAAPTKRRLPLNYMQVPVPPIRLWVMQIILVVIGWSSTYNKLTQPKLHGGRRDRMMDF